MVRPEAAAGCVHMEKYYFSRKIGGFLRLRREMAAFLSKTHSLFLKKAKQMCKAQKIGLCNKWIWHKTKNVIK